jgi:hypothetical protein
VTDGQLKELMVKLDQQIKLGLNHKTREKSSVKCFNTYVQDLPSGKGEWQRLISILFMMMECNPIRGKHYHLIKS